MTAVAFAGCFLALATVSGLAAAAGPRWALRLPLLVATPLLALAVWWQLSQRTGWPSDGHPADGSQFVAGVVRPPTPSDRGAIYLWTQPPNSATPRAYRLPYSPQLERQVTQASRQARRGRPVGLRTVARHARAKGRQETQSPRSPFRFYRLPPPSAPAKDTHRT
jgi:hypothetical protein